MHLSASINTHEINEYIAFHMYTWFKYHFHLFYRCIHSNFRIIVYHKKWKREAHGQNPSPEKQFQWISIFVQSYVYTITFRERNHFLLFEIWLVLFKKNKKKKQKKKTWVPFTQRCFVPCLVEISPVDLEKMKMWNVSRKTDGQQTTIFAYIAKGFAHGPFSLHPWQIELEFRIHVLSIFIGCSYY